MYDKKKLMVYLVWAFGLAWSMQIAASYFVNQGNAAAFQGIMAASMFAPLVAAALAKTGVKSIGWRPRIKGRGRYLLAAFFLPILLSVLGGALFYLLFPQALDTSFGYIATQMGEEAVAALEAQGMGLSTYAIIMAVQALTYAPFLNSIAAVGEEAGWRGVMYPMLKEKWGVLRGRLIGGCIWGAWHWPVMILAGYEYGKDYFGAPLTGMLAFCVFTTAAGIFLDWLYDNTHCIWYPALGHGAINATANVPIVLLNPLWADKLLVGPLMIGLVSGLPLVCLAIYLSVRQKKSA